MHEDIIKRRDDAGGHFRREGQMYMKGGMMQK